MRRRGGSRQSVVLSERQGWLTLQAHFPASPRYETSRGLEARGLLRITSLTNKAPLALRANNTEPA
eukprot:7099890-Prymnesium_polylepis.1